MATNYFLHQECIDTFTQLLEAPSYEKRYYVLAGPFGCGKSTLFAILRSICIQQQAAQHSFDLATIPTVERFVDTFLTSIGLSVNTPELDSALSYSESFLDLPIFSTAQSEATGSSKKSTYALLEDCAELVNRQVGGRKLVLFLDQIEIWSNLLAPLYNHFLALLSPNVLVVLATRKEHAVAQILPTHSTAYCRLRSLTADESTAFLQARGIASLEQAAAISKLARGNLFLLGKATLDPQFSLQEPNLLEPALVRDGIERALKEVQNQHLISLVRLASVARWFNLEILRRLSSSGNIEKLYSQLGDLSFFEETDGGLRFDALLHSLLFEQWQIQAPKRFGELNTRVLNYYSNVADITTDERSYRLVLEKVYHMVCADEIQGLEYAAEQAVFASFTGNSSLCHRVWQSIAELPLRFNAIPAWLDFFEASCNCILCNWINARRIVEARLHTTGVITLLGGYLTACLATILFDMGSWSDAERTARDALAIFEAVGSSNGCFFAHIAMADALMHQHKWDLAQKELDLAQSILRESKSDIKECIFLMSQAESYRTQGQWEPAASALSSLTRLAEQYGNESLLANILDAQGKLFRDRQDWSHAQVCFAQCRQISQKTGNLLSVAKALHSSAGVSLRQGELDNAEEFYTRSLAIKENLGDIYGIAKTQNGLGHIERLRGNLQAALDHYVISQQLFSQIGNLPKLGRVSCRIGMTLHELNDLDRAITELEASKRVRLSYGDFQGVSECYSELGRVIESKGATTQAVEQYELSRRYAAESNSVTRQLLPLVQLTALALRRLSTPLGSRDYVEQARRITESSYQQVLLSQLYQKRALYELQHGYERSCFALLTESVYVAAHSNEHATREALRTFWHTLSTIASTSPFDAVVDEYCHKSLEYWNKSCEPAPMHSVIWRQLTSPDAKNAMQTSGQSARFIREMVSTGVEPTKDADIW